MRHDQTDPSMNTTTNRDLPVRTEAADDGAPLRRRERAGSPSPEALDGATSWQDIKSRFVDDPAGALAAAEQLVRRAVDQRIRAMKEEADAMCMQGRDGESSTEDQRMRLIRYQEYCNRLGAMERH